MNEKAIKEALARQKAILDSARAENRDMTADEQRAFDELQSLIDVLRADDPTPSNDPAPAPPSNDPTPEPSGERGETPPAYTPETASEILAMCRHFGMTDDAQDYISRGLTVEAARAEIMNKLMTDNRPLGNRITSGGDENEKNFRAAVVDGILLRQGIDVENPTDGANRFRGMSIKEIGVECLERQGGGTDYRHMNTDSILEQLTRRFNDPTNTRDFYNPVAAFPAILDDVFKKAYVAGMRRAPVQFDKWVRYGTLPNFKKTTNHDYIASYAGELAEVPENGELEAYVPTDALMPERQLKTYGRQFTMSRQAFIDDDIGLLTTMPARFAEITLRTQNKQIYNILVSNPKQVDGKELFHKNRKNTLTDGTGISLASIEKMIFMLGMQIDAAGNQLGLMPDLFIVPLGLGSTLRSLLYSKTIETKDNTQAMNPYADMDFTIVEDVTLNILAGEGVATPWYIGVKGEIIQLDTLNGQKEANIRRSEKPGVLGFSWDVYADWGVSVRHPECIIRNPGTTITAG